MVIVESVALSIMISNDLVIPLVLRRGTATRDGKARTSALPLNIRRLAIFVIMLMAYFYYRAHASTACGDRPDVVRSPRPAGAGLLRRPVLAGGNARGAMTGMLVGFAVWAYTLFLPSFLEITPPGCCCCNTARSASRRCGRGHCSAPIAAADARRAVEALAQYADLHRDIARAGRPRSNGCRRSVRAQQADADAPTFRRLRTTVTVRTSRARWRNISAPERAGQAFEAFAAGHPGNLFRPRPPISNAATRRTTDRLLDRGRLLAPRDVAVAAQAHRLRQGRAEAARRFATPRCISTARSCRPR